MLTTESRPRRAATWLRRAAVALLLTAGVVTAAAQPAMASHGGDNSIVGHWTTTVTVNTNPPSTVELIFFSSHVVEIRGPRNASGEPAYVGFGPWSQTSTGAFSFQVVHPLPDANGNLLGFIHGSQQGQVNGDTFSSSGVSHLYKTDGTVVGPNSVTMTGVRTAG